MRSKASRSNNQGPPTEVVVGALSFAIFLFSCLIFSLVFYRLANPFFDLGAWLYAHYYAVATVSLLVMLISFGCLVASFCRSQKQLERFEKRRAIKELINLSQKHDDRSW